MSTDRTYRIKADDDGARVDRWFKRNMPEVPHALVSRWARTGALRVDGDRVETGTRIETGQEIRFPAADATPVRAARTRRPLSPDEVELAQSMVIHRDRAALILNKPPGLATQGGSGTTLHVDGLLDALADNVMGRPKLVHRLDKDTSGALLVARSPGAAARFSKSFSGRTARKIYWAIVIGVPSIRQGQIDLPLAKQPGTGGEKMHVDTDNGQRAVSRYRVIDTAGTKAAWVELQPLTGRTHQLRAHMAAIGHPIVGDGKYGGKDAFLTGAMSRKMHLHARRLRIEHPDGHMLDVSADLPAHFAESLTVLGFDEMAGDALALVDHEPRATKDERKTAAKHHAKDIRKARKGERRARGNPAHASKPGKSSKPGKPKATAKPAGKKAPSNNATTPRSASSRSTARPTSSRGSIRTERPSRPR